MKARFHSDTRKDFCFPFSGKPIERMEMGPVSLEMFLEEYLDVKNCEWSRGGQGECCDLVVSLNALPEKAVLQEFLHRVSGRNEPAILQSIDHEEVLAWWCCDSSHEDAATAVRVGGSFIRLSYYWDLIALHEKLAPSLTPCFDGEAVSSLASVNGVLRMGEGSVMLPGVVVEGFVRIGSNCRIGPNCLIRGCTSIGDGCVIGQSVEIKNSIIGSGTMIPHLSYVGDSVIGSGVNIGAGGICSNFRHDEGLHRVMIGESLVDTGRQKLGALIGDGAKLGCHTVVYPGRMVAVGKTTLPGEIIAKDRE